MNKYYAEVIERLQKLVFTLTNENEELKNQIEKLTRENVGLTRELENSRSDNF